MIYDLHQLSDNLILLEKIGFNMARYELDFSNDDPSTAIGSIAEALEELNNDLKAITTIPEILTKTEQQQDTEVSNDV